MQYGHELNIGRTGAALDILRLDGRASVEFTWCCLFNSKGIQIDRIDSDSNATRICGFEDILYPDNVEQGEIDLISMLVGKPVKEDGDVIRLCSFLVAKWAAGHSEESFIEVIISTLKTWSDVEDPDNISDVP